MAKRIRQGKQDAVPLPLIPLELNKTASSTALKGKTSTPTNAEGKHVMLPAFLSKTYEIFSMPEFSHVCGWNANGDTIIVSQLEAFVAKVLPRFFKHRNFPSFVRQLNLYGFHKTVLDSKRLEFQHPFFKRGRPDLLHHIKRKVSSNNHQNSQLVSASAQNSRLDAHREISDTLLREMKELRQRSDAMEKRLRELEIDNAIVRSDNVKLWKHLEDSKDKQLIMHEKMKKIMWILFQIYRGKHHNIPKLSSNDANGAVISEDYVKNSMLAPKEFRDVLRFLAMDEPPLLPGSTATVSNTASGSRKRKFVEVPSDVGDVGAPYKLDNEPSSVVDVPNRMEEMNRFAMTVPSSSLSMAHSDGTQNSMLSIFSPLNPVSNSVPNGECALGGYLTNGDVTTSSPIETAVSDPTVSTPTPSTASTSPPTVSTPTASTPTASSSSVSTPAVSNGVQTPQEQTVALQDDVQADSTMNSSNQLTFLDEDLPLLPDADHYNFTEGEQAVMKKLEDFETSLLDEYDVSCLDTLLQQLKNSSGGDKAAGVTVADPEEIIVGPTHASLHDA